MTKNPFLLVPRKIKYQFQLLICTKAMITCMYASRKSSQVPIDLEAVVELVPLAVRCSVWSPVVVVCSETTAANLANDTGGSDGAGRFEVH